MSLPIDCAGFTEDCTTRTTVLRTLRPYRVGGRRIRKGTRITERDRDLDRGNKTKLKLTRLGQRLLARRGKIRLGARTTISDSAAIERRRGRIIVR